MRKNCSQKKLIFFSPKNKVQSSNNNKIIQHAAKIDIKAKEFLLELYDSKNSSSYTRLPIFEPLPAAQNVPIFKNINLVIGIKAKLGKGLNIDLVEDNKCINKTKIIFILFRAYKLAA